ncbi:exported serine/threonine protein kinase, partial [Hepatocystis sp. ex Piliocolobus tephrosceles]
ASDDDTFFKKIEKNRTYYLSKDDRKKKDSNMEETKGEKKGLSNNSTSSNKKTHIVVTKRSSNVLRNLIDFKNIEDGQMGENEKTSNNRARSSTKNISDHNYYHEVNLVKQDTIKSRLRSVIAKEKNKSLQYNSSNTKSLSKYDFLMNKNENFNTVNIGGNKKGKETTSEMKNVSNKYNESMGKKYTTLDKKNDTTLDKKNDTTLGKKNDT